METKNTTEPLSCLNDHALAGVVGIVAVVLGQLEHARILDRQALQFAEFA